MVALLLTLTLIMAAPTATPTATPTSTATSTATATATRVPSATASLTPSPSPSPTPLVHSGSGGTPDSPCSAGAFGLGIPVFGTVCIPLGDLFGAVFKALAGLFSGALGVILTPFVAMLTVTPDLTRWPDVASIFTSLWGIGVAMYGTFIVFAALHHYRRMMWHEPGNAPLLGLSDAVVGAMLVGGLPWIMSTWFGLVNDLAQSINGAVGTLSFTALERLFTDAFAVMDNNPLLLAADVVLGFLMLLFTLLVGLIRLGGLCALLWLYLIGPLALGCWVYPPTRGIAVRWATSFASVSLWGCGFALALKAIELMALDLPQSDPAYANPIIEALTAVAAMFFLFAVPRFVDAIVGSVASSVSGAYGLAMQAGALAGGAVRAAVGGKT